MISLFLDQDTKYNNNINIKERDITYYFFAFPCWIWPLKLY